MENNKYHRGKIYAIRSHQTPAVYIGSTCDRLSRRLSTHKNDYKRFNNGIKSTSNMSSFSILKYPDYYIELIEEFKCNNKMELTRREGEIIRATENCVNKRIEGRTMAEYRNDNKERISNMCRKYKNDNKEQIDIMKKKYYEKNQEQILKKHSTKFNCECGGRYTYGHKARHLKTNKHKNYLETV